MSSDRVPDRPKNWTEHARVGDKDDKGADTEEDSTTDTTPCGEEVDEAKEADEEPQVTT